MHHRSDGKKEKNRLKFIFPHCDIEEVCTIPLHEKINDAVVMAMMMIVMHRDVMVMILMIRNNKVGYDHEHDDPTSKVESAEQKTPERLRTDPFDEQCHNKHH